LVGNSFPIFALGFSADGKRLAGTGFNRGQTLVWDVPSGKQIASYQGNVSTVSGVAYSADGNYLLTVDSRWGLPAAVVWDVVTGKPRGYLRGHDKAIFSAACAPDGKTMATASSDGTIRLWDSETLDQSAVDRLATQGRKVSALRWITYSADSKY